MNQKLSELLIEIAEQGLKSKKYKHSEVMHPLMFLSYISWNRTTLSPDYMESEYKNMINDFEISKHKLDQELVSTDLEELISIMIKYKADHFSDDKRIITACGFTPHNTLRVEWK